MSKRQRRSLADAAAAKDRSHHPLADEMKKDAATIDEPTRQIHVYAPESLHREFKIKTTTEGKSMNEVLLDFIRGYVAG